MSEAQTKVCTKCGVELPATTEYWHKAKLGKYGLTAICKACASEYRAARYQANRTASLEQNKKYNREHPEVARAASRKYYHSHPEAVEEYARTYYQEHQEELRAYTRSYYAENTEKAKECSRDYQLLHPEVKRASQAKRKAQKLGNGGEYSGADIRSQYNEQDGLCFYCGCEVGSNYHVDHYIPLALGGSNGPENIVIACPTCNMRKHDMHPDEFLARLVS